MRERPDEYFYKYGSPTIYEYAPKSDTVFVVLILLLAVNGFSWFAQKQRWQQIANRVVKDAVEGLEIGNGGSTESIELRKKAALKLKEKEASSGGAETKATDNDSKKKKKIKLTKKELKEKENEELRPFLQELVNDITDFGAGFHQPTWRDLFIVRMVQWPGYIAKGLLWQTKYFIRRLQKLDLNEEEREVLAQRAVGPVAWEAASDKDQEEMISREVWIMENLELWLEDQEIRQYSKGQQKRITRAKKKEGWKNKSE
jgi:DnaJ family protein C protein 25